VDAVTDQENWAILRQLVLATDDALGAAARIAQQLRLPTGFADPMLAGIGLADAAMPVGPVQFLEVVGPLDASSYINRWLRKVGGAGGYCLSVQVPDAPGCKARAEALGVRLAADEVLMGHPLIQLHPADVGILLELDGVSDPTTWFWDDVTPGPAADALIDSIVSVTVGAPDPSATAAQWAHIIGLELAAPTALDFSGCLVDFVAHPVGQVLAAQFQLAPGIAAPAVDELLGLRVSFRAAASRLEAVS
jgi:hypothetical protein